MPAKSGETRETLAQQAEHARRLAKLLPGDPAADRLLACADELDAQAAALDGDRKDV